jgi:hypothetical protein
VDTSRVEACRRRGDRLRLHYRDPPTARTRSSSPPPPTAASVPRK